MLGFAAAFSPQLYADTQSPRVSAMYTTWDNYYFYAGFEVNDRNVLSTNTTPVSQPQQDDDVEVFFETDNAGADHRTPHTYQMAVSADNGAYFSVGDNSPIPKARAVYTYKYAAKVEGTLNDPSTPDAGYTVEIAFPWQGLGLSGPPDVGTQWGFNVISRDRDSTSLPPNRLYSFSDKVQSAADVQDPSKWGKIVFDKNDAAKPSPYRPATTVAAPSRPSRRRRRRTAAARETWRPPRSSADRCGRSRIRSRTRCRNASWDQGLVCRRNGKRAARHPATHPVATRETTRRSATSPGQVRHYRASRSRGCQR